MGFQDCIFWTSPFLPLPGKWLYRTNYFFDILFFFADIQRDSIYIRKSRTKKRRKFRQIYIFLWRQRCRERNYEEEDIEMLKKIESLTDEEGRHRPFLFSFLAFFFFCKIGFNRGLWRNDKVITKLILILLES